MSVNPFLTESERSRLEGALIGVAGAGGLGSNCVAHLVRSGVRRFVIADFDVVGASNLNRQFFFADQLGRFKVDALRENLLRIAPELELELWREPVTAVNARSLFGRCDIVIEALDSAAAKQLLFDALLPTGKPIVGASGIAGWGRSAAMKLHRLGGRLYLVGDGESEADPERHLAPFSPRVGIAAAMQANTAVALLLGETV